MIDTIQHAGSINPQVNQADSPSLPSRIVDAIKNAATRTGVDFSYLMHKAAQESGFDPNAKASSSSATGLFQFTNQTWLTMLKEHGGEYGLSAYSDHIQVDNSGVAHVDNPSMKKAILALRKDPEISAEMAGELDKDNLDSLKSNVGGKIGATDLYLAHFLGAGGASTFLKQMKVNPNANAAQALPDAAASNPSVFYSADGNPRTLKQIYQHFAQKFDDKMPASQMVASSNRTHVVKPDASTYSVASAAYTNMTSTPNSYLPSVMSQTIKSNSTSSLMATMIMAQMHMDTLPSANISAATAADHSKKPIASAVDLIG